jgi:hypothetical protein
MHPLPLLDTGQAQKQTEKNHSLNVSYYSIVTHRVSHGHKKNLMNAC